MLKLLNSNELSLLKSSSISIMVGKNQPLFSQNTPVSHIVFLKKGLVKVFAENVKGESSVINIGSPGSFFGIRCTITQRLLSN